jgi:hypothetical protein
MDPMFLAMFWMASYFPVAVIVLSPMGEWLKNSFHKLHAHTRLAPARGRHGHRPAR